MKTVTAESIDSFRNCLLEEEKSAATLERYLRDVRAFAAWLGSESLDKEHVLEYKRQLIERYAAASVNAILSSLNRFFAHRERYDLRVRTLKVQRRIFAESTRELTKSEYHRLLREAQNRKNERLYLLMQTICSTGIRVSELRFVTASALEAGKAEIACKGKRRTVFLPNDLCKMLRRYVKTRKIKSGSIFVTRNGKPLDRSNIWSDMKKLCAAAGVPKTKVFPHNLRHLFARTYYSVQKDIVRLADLLGHSSVNTTRIYTMESGEVHRKQIQSLGLLQVLRN